MNQYTITQNLELIKHLSDLLNTFARMGGQQRVHNRIMALLIAELMTLGRHTITQLLITLGLNNEDWSAWYRIFSQGGFNAQQGSELLLEASLEHVRVDEVYVVAGDGTQTPRSSGKIEGSGWLRNPRNPPFMIGIHYAQRWFNGSWLLPAEKGYSRAMPLQWLPCFTEKSKPQEHPPQTEWQAATSFLRWLRQGLDQRRGRQQMLLMVADGSYDSINMWRNLPDGVILLARSAKNRALYNLPPAQCHRNRKYGEKAAQPQHVWQKRQGWQKIKLQVRGLERHLQYKIKGPFLRKPLSDRPLFLIVVRGKKRRRGNKTYRREPLPFLVNAVQNEDGEWILPLPIETLLFWAWQRWEIEVCHRELKSNFGLGHKQCWNPQSAVSSVQWSAWAYSLFLLAAYRTWGLCHAPPVPTRWWRGSGRWSFNTLWRTFRATLWGNHHFRPFWTGTPNNWPGKEDFLQGLGNALYGAAHS